MSIGGWSARRRVAALLLALVLVPAACGNSGDDDEAAGGGGSSPDGSAAPVDGVPGVTDDEIRYAAFGTRSNNPTGACVLDCFVDGIEAYFAFRNSEGGVHGRDMVLTTVLDDELSENQERALEIVSANDTFGAFSATQLASGWHDITEAGMPLYVWGIHSAEMNGEDAIFANNGVICGTCTSRTQPYAGTLVDASKVGVLGYGVSQASKDCAGAQAASVERYGGETGQEVAFLNDELAFGLPNGIAPEVSAMKRAGVDFITACLDLNGMKTLAQELERQGMGDVPMLHPNTYDARFVADAGELFEGDLVQVSFRPFEADPGDSGLADYLEWMEETGSELSETAMVGWINADLAYQGLVAAGESFDRASVIEATNEITDYTADGLLNPIDWSRQHDAPTEDDPADHGYSRECVSLVQVHDGAFELVGDPEKPFWCWDGGDRDWAEPEETDFE
ncbi:MAG TPA: ABC transporter substrate-binding protein [Acidimicrobiales bacterium]